MKGKKLKRTLHQSAATPGGAPSNAAKRQKIKHLDNRHRDSAPTNPEPFRTLKKHRRQRSEGSIYDPLSPEIKSGPHCQNLNAGEAAALPAGNTAKEPVMGLLTGLASTDPSQGPERIEKDLDSSFGSRPVVSLGGDRKGKARKGKQGAKAGPLMSNTARKKRGLDPLQSAFTLESLESLHAVWEASATEMAASMADGLVAQRIDFHGCRLKVVKSRNPMLVGREGVVVKDSTMAVHLAAPPPVGARKPRYWGGEVEADPSLAKLYHVPKAGTTFTFLLPGRELEPRLVTLFGANLGRQPKK